MRDEVRGSYSYVGEYRSGETHTSGNSGTVYFIKPEYVRKPASIRPRKTDNLRVGGRRSNDRSRCRLSEDIGRVNPMKHKALIAFAWVTIVSAVAAGMIMVLAIRKIGLL